MFHTCCPCAIAELPSSRSAGNSGRQAQSAWPPETAELQTSVYPLAGAHSASNTSGLQSPHGREDCSPTFCGGFPTTLIFGQTKSSAPLASKSPATQSTVVESHIVEVELPQFGAKDEPALLERVSSIPRGNDEVTGRESSETTEELRQALQRGLAGQSNGERARAMSSSPTYTSGKYSQSMPAIGETEAAIDADEVRTQGSRRTEGSRPETTPEPTPQQARSARHLDSTLSISSQTSRGAMTTTGTVSRFPSASTVQEKPAETVNCAVDISLEVLAQVKHEVCLLGITQKNDEAIIEPEFQEKHLEISGIGKDKSLRDKLAKIGIGLACKKARKPEMPNQDNIFLCRTSDYTIFGVVDGHGENGHWVSHWVARFVLHLALRDIAEHGIKCLTDALVTMRIFNLAHEALQLRAALEKFDVEMSGTTLCLCAIDHATHEVYAASVGDSGCVLSRATNDEPEFITHSHKPEDIEERRRIVERGGEVRDGRVWMRGKEHPGLAMSRSIGDLVGHTCGVIHQPGVRHLTLEAKKRKSVQHRHLLICCSDGVWDFMEPDEAVKLIREMGPQRVSEATEALVAEARNRWLKEKNGASTDDISAIAVWI